MERVYAMGFMGQPTGFSLNNIRAQPDKGEKVSLDKRDHWIGKISPLADKAFIRPAG